MSGSGILQRILHHYLLDTEEDIFFSPKEITEEDRELVDRGVLYLSKRERRHIRCPLCRGGLVPIYTDRLPSGTMDHFVICEEYQQRVEIDPADYQIYEYDEKKFLSSYGQTVRALMNLQKETKKDSPLSKRSGTDQLIIDEMVRIYLKRLESEEKPNKKEIAEITFRRHLERKDDMTFKTSEQLRSVLRYELEKLGYR